MKTPPYLEAILNHHFGIHNIDEVIKYIAKERDIREAKKAMQLIEAQAPLKELLAEIIQSKYAGPNISSDLPLLSIVHELLIRAYVKDPTSSFHKGLKNQFKQVFIDKIKHDFFFYFLPSMLFISFLQEGLGNNIYDITISILTVLFIYYIMIPKILSRAVKSEVIDNYIKDKIKSYTQMLNPLSSSSVQTRFKRLKEEIQIEENMCQEIPGPK